MRLHFIALILCAGAALPTALAANTSKLVIAHRGASGYLPEHTLPSAALAYGLGADFIEPDVVLTKDGVPVVLHDIHLEATTDVAAKFPSKKRADGRWYAIDLTLAEVKTLSVAERRALKGGKAVFPERFPESTRILQVPTLEEMIQLVQGLNRSTGRDVGLYPEFKSPAFHQQEGQDIAKVLLDVLARYGYKDATANVYVQCFDAAALKAVRSVHKSKLKLVQLIGENSWGESQTDYDAMRSEAGIKDVASYADGIGPWIPHVLAMDKEKKAAKVTDLAKWAHANKLVVHPYTIRREDVPPGMTLDQVHAMLFNVAGVDGVFSDFTDLTVGYLRAAKLR